MLTQVRGWGQPWEQPRGCVGKSQGLSWPWPAGRIDEDQQEWEGGSGLGGLPGRWTSGPETTPRHALAPRGWQATPTPSKNKSHWALFVWEMGRGVREKKCSYLTTHFKVPALMQIALPLTPYLKSLNFRKRNFKNTPITTAWGNAESCYRRVSMLENFPAWRHDASWEQSRKTSQRKRHVWSEPQQWQHQMLNPVGHQGTPKRFWYCNSSFTKF